MWNPRTHPLGRHHDLLRYWDLNVARFGLAHTTAVYSAAAARKSGGRGRRRRILRAVAVGIGVGVIAHALVPFWYQAIGGALLGLANPGLALTLPIGLAAPVVGVPSILAGGAGVGSAAGISLSRVTEAAVTPMLHRGLFHGSRFWLGAGLGIAGGYALGLLGQRD